MKSVIILYITTIDINMIQERDERVYLTFEKFAEQALNEFSYKSSIHKIFANIWKDYAEAK